MRGAPQAVGPYPQKEPTAAEPLDALGALPRRAELAQLYVKLSKTLHRNYIGASPRCVHAGQQALERRKRRIHGTLEGAV
jgi:hypothetical protein